MNKNVKINFRYQLNFALKFHGFYQNGISMPKCACGKKPQDDEIRVKGKNAICKHMFAMILNYKL